MSLFFKHYCSFQNQNSFSQLQYLTKSCIQGSYINVLSWRKRLSVLLGISLVFQANEINSVGILKKKFILSYCLWWSRTLFHWEKIRRGKRETGILPHTLNKQNGLGKKPTIFERLGKKKSITISPHTHLNNVFQHSCNETNTFNVNNKPMKNCNQFHIC